MKRADVGIIYFFADNINRPVHGTEAGKGSIVHRDIAEYSVAGGVPAKLIKRR